MKTKELYDMILSTMSSEEALMKILDSQINIYNTMYVGLDDKRLNPTILIFLAAQELGMKIVPVNRGLSIEERGVVIGGRKFIENLTNIISFYEKGDKKFVYCNKCKDGVMLLDSFSEDYKQANFVCNNCKHEEHISDPF